MVANLSAVPDETYALWVNEIDSISPKQRKRLKFKLEMGDGCLQTVRFEGDGFYSYYLNRRIKCISASEGNLLRALKPDTTVQHEEVFHLDEESWCDFVDGQIEATHTGNHQPRNHRISIPTRAGEPVRG